MSARNVLTVILTFALWPTAHAWDQHTLIMQGIGRTAANLPRRYLFEKVQIPTLAEEKAVIHELAAKLFLNEAAIPVYGEKHPGQKDVELYELFRSEMIDEPDLGMDQNLPDSADPNGYRYWMGGKVGVMSQGFRHMFYSGFDYKMPVQTLQIPMHAVGESRERYKKMLAVSDQFFKDNNRFWGTRTLLWALHYLQDLHQPFHVLQVPYWRFLPLEYVFSDFVGHSTHAMKNYHFAYEGFARTYLQHYEQTNFRGCFETDKPIVSTDLSEVVQTARDANPQMAIPLYELLGPSLKSPDVDLEKNPGVVDYWHVIQTSTDDNLKKLRDVTCTLYQSIAQYVWGHFDRAFNYIPDSSIKRGR